MNIAFIVEDSSTEALLNQILPSILNRTVEYKVYSHKGLGHFPKQTAQFNQNKKSEMLYENLPRLLRGFAKTPHIDGVVILCDSDEKDTSSLLNELNNFIGNITPLPKKHLVCLAIEETEAWYFGDIKALKKAYPRVNQKIIDSYRQDIPCQTWEKLAEAVVEKNKLHKVKLFPMSGHFKHECAQNIGKHMNVDDNKSPSFQKFRDDLRHFIKE